MAKTISFKIEIEGTQQQAIRLNEIDAKLTQINATRKQNLKILSLSKGKNTELSKALAKQTTEVIGLKQEKSKLTQSIKLENTSLNKLGNSYDKLVADTRQAKNAAKELGARYGQTDKRFLKAAKSAGVLDRRLKKLDKAVGDNFRSVGNYEKGLKRAGAGLAKIGIGIGVTVAAFSRITRAVGASIEAFGEQERTEKALEVALGFTSKALLDQAAALQKTTKFGDESIVQSQAFLAQFGLQEDQIKKLTPAILDFAEAQGVSLEDASKLLSKSLGSSTNALSRYGIEITGAVGSNERLESAITSLNDKFAGQAAAAAQVGTGPLTQLKNVFGDLQEQIGGFIVRGITPLLSGLSNLAVKIGENVFGTEELSDTYFDMKDEVNSLENDLVPLLDRYDELNEKTELSVEEQTELEDIIGKVAAIVPSAVTEFDKYGKALGISTKAAKEFIQEQKAILEITNAEAIEEQVDAIDDLTSQKRRTNLSKINGVYAELNITYTKSGRAIKTVVALTNEEITRRINLRKKLQLEIDARNAIIANLKGEKSAAEIAAEAEAKRNKEEGDAIVKQTGLIEKQAKKVSELQKAKKAASTEPLIIEIDTQLKIEQKVLKRLQDLAARPENEIIIPLTPKVSFDELDITDEEKKKAKKELEDRIFKDVKISGKAEVDLELSEESVNKIQDDIKAAQELLKAGAVKAAQELSDSLFEQSGENRQRELERDLQDLEVKKNLELSAIQDDADTENEILKSKLQKGLITEQQFADQKAIADENRRNQELKANEKALQQQRKLEKIAFEQKKKQDIAQAIINGVLAFTSILATSPDILKPIGPLFNAQVALAAASTGLAVASIASQKFAKGGVVEGASHDNGGVSFNGGAYELEGGETIINKRSSSMFRNELSAMNQAGGGIKFANGGVITPVASEPANQLNVASLAEDVANTIRVENVATETASVNNEVVDVANVASA